MAGKVTSLEGLTPQPQLRHIASYEVSPMFSRSSSERYNPDELISRKGMKIYRQMTMDEQVKAVINFKRDALTARGWHVTYPNEKARDLSDPAMRERIHVLEQILVRMKGSFDDAISAISMGRVYGFSMTEIVYDTVKIDKKSYIGLHSLMPRDASTFVFHSDKYGVLQKVVQKMAADEIQVDLGKFIHYVQGPEEDQYYGLSDLRQAYRAWYIKDQVIKLYAIFLERFAGGFAVMSLDPQSGIVPGSREHQALEATLRNLRNLAGILLPPGVSLELAKPATTEEYREALTYFDLAIAKSLLVPNLLGLSHTGQTGSFSQSQTQLEAFFWTLNADTRRLEACINEQLIKRICDLNWGDGDYPMLRFKPASQDHVRWLVGAWKDLVSARAVETTPEDEEHLRALLDMPSRKIEEDIDEAAKSKDPYSVLDGPQIKALLEVIAAVATGQIPKETAAQIISRSFPISAEDAAAMVEPVEVKPPPVLGALPGSPGGSGEGAATTAGTPPSSSPPSGSPAPPRVVAHTQDGQPRVASMSAFTRAVLRVDFSVIERRTAVLSDDATVQIAKLIAKAVSRVLTEERLAEIAGDPSQIEHFKFDGADVGKIKAAFKDALYRGWMIGLDSARKELTRNGKVSVASFTDLRDRAAGYFEANGFRMAANVSDGARAIIQQHLIQAVKQGLRTEDVYKNIYLSLASKGFTTIDAMDLETNDPNVVDYVRAELGLAASANVAAYISTLVRTNVFEAMNEARYAEFTDPALDGFVLALEYSAILDDRTTDICRELDGKVFAADSPEWDLYRPPNHYNCRSVLVPVTVNDGWDGTGSPPPTIKPQEGFGALPNG